MRNLIFYNWRSVHPRQSQGTTLCLVHEVGFGPPTAEGKILKNCVNFDCGVDTFVFFSFDTISIQYLDFIFDTIRYRPAPKSANLPTIAFWEPNLPTKARNRNFWHFRNIHISTHQIFNYLYQANSAHEIWTCSQILEPDWVIVVIQVILVMLPRSICFWQLSTLHFIFTSLCY